MNRFSQLFHCQNREKICNNTIIKDPTTPHSFIHSYSFIKVGLTHCDNLKYIAKVENSVCVAILPCEMSSVFKATIENKTTSVTTHF